MKVLYGIQGTGNGHVTRAMEILPHLMKKADVDVLISGEQYDLPLAFEPEYRRKGLYFVFGKNGGINLPATFKKIDSFRLRKEIKELPVEKYDVVISDFEPITSWACNLRKKRCIGLSNQAATLHPKAPKPDVFDPAGKLILGYYAPVSEAFGFHFKKLGPEIYTPIIRSAIRECKTETFPHYTVYLPSFSDEKIIKHLKKLDHVKWEVFSKHCKKSYRTGRISVRKVESEPFMESMSTSSGIITNAGFGTTSEALFLGKKLLVIPMKNQYEQQCNAAMLASMGVTVIKNLKKKQQPVISNWLDRNSIVKVDYKDQTASIVDAVLKAGIQPVSL